MPLGNLTGSATMFPDESRLTCQQSSMLMYRYPALFMPLATIASAISLINCSLTLHPNLFQLFQPIGGVRASPLSSENTGVVFALIANRTKTATLAVSQILSLDLQNIDSSDENDFRGAASSGESTANPRLTSSRFVRASLCGRPLVVCGPC